jgi:hypothetical protein
MSIASHQSISFTKSALRILGYAILILDPVFAIVVLIVSEALGIVEEIGHE